MERIQRGSRSGRVNQWRQWPSTPPGEMKFALTCLKEQTLGATYATVKDHGIQYVQEKTYKGGM
jgi:hypothetical protein